MDKAANRLPLRSAAWLNLTWCGLRAALSKAKICHMKMFDSVVIACDQGSLDLAQALRASLELFRLHAYLHFCVQKRNVVDLLAGNIPDSHYIVLCNHGLGATDMPDENPDAMRMGFHVVDEADNYKSIDFALTPANIASFVRLPGRTVLALGCGSGREPLAQAFLESGCQAYIGALAPIDQDSTTLFAITFFYHLLCAEREAHLQCSGEEAVRRASALDTYSKDGTHLFRYYSKSA